MNFTKHDGFLLCCSVIIYKGSRDTYYVRIKNPDFYHETPIRSKEHNKLVVLLCEHFFGLNNKKYLEDDIPYVETSLQIDYIILCVLIHSLIIDGYVMTKYLDDVIAFEDCMTVYRRILNPPNLEDND
jgi:hypothetical protein